MIKTILLALMVFILVGCSCKQCDPTYIYVDRNITVEIPTKCKHQSCVKGLIYNTKEISSYEGKAKALKSNNLTEKEYQLCLEDSISKCEQN